jgi:uncharacterized membrane protein YcaP (DUF421 family)
MGQLLGVTAMEGVAIVIAAVVVFALALAVLRVAGIRSATRLRTADVAVLLVIGAVLGRAILGQRPTLVGGIIALAVLILLRLLAGRLERSRLRRLVAARPVLLLADGRPIEQHVRRSAVSEADLRVALRLAGVASPSEVVAAVLEPNGAISVARRDPSRPLDRRLFADVMGVERIADSSFGPPIEE